MSDTVFWHCFWRERTWGLFVTAMWDDVECAPNNKIGSEKHADCGYLRAEIVGKDMEDAGKPS